MPFILCVNIYCCNSFQIFLYIKQIGSISPMPLELYGHFQFVSRTLITPHFASRTLSLFYLTRFVKFSVKNRRKKRELSASTRYFSFSFNRNFNRKTV